MRRLTIALLAVGVCAACHDSGVTMSPVPPPQSWADQLEADRSERDRDFAKDPDSPIPKTARERFRGLTYYPADASWRYAGWIERYAVAEKLELVTTNGERRPCEKWGRLTFAREGTVATLQVYRLLDQPDRPGGDGLFLPFKDRSAGKETYPAGRYVDLSGPDGGPFVLDFNRAYNPSCAYGEPERFQCPVTPAENALAIAVTAGERGPGKQQAEPAH
jgi:uncharacterized protein (DUF1684 family)